MTTLPLERVQSPTRVSSPRFSSLSLNTKKISIHAPWWINLECVQFVFFERKWCEKVLRIKIRKITKRRDDFFFYINRNYSSFNDIYNSNELFKRFQLINIWRYWIYIRVIRIRYLNYTWIKWWKKACVQFRIVQLLQRINGVPRMGKRKRWSGRHEKCFNTVDTLVTLFSRWGDRGVAWSPINKNMVDGRAPWNGYFTD